MRRPLTVASAIASLLAILSCMFTSWFSDPTSRMIVEFLCRFGGALGLGAVVGFERRMKHKVAGVRTHMVMSASACLAVLVSCYVSTQHSGVDPLRMSAQIFSALGMFGLGVIIRKGESTSGVTTLATISFSVVVGTACGCYYLPLVVAAVVMLMVALALSYHYMPTIEPGVWLTIVGTPEKVEIVIVRLGQDIHYGSKEPRGSELMVRVRSTLSNKELSNVVASCDPGVSIQIEDPS